MKNSISHYLWKNVHNAEHDSEFLKEFNMTNKEEATKLVKSAFKNCKKRKACNDGLKLQFQRNEEAFNKFINSRQASVFFLERSVEEHTIQRDIYHTDIGARFYEAESSKSKKQKKNHIDQLNDEDFSVLNQTESDILSQQDDIDILKELEQEEVLVGDKEDQPQQSQSQPQNEEYDSQLGSFTDASTDSYIAEDITSDDDSQLVETEETFDFLTTTEGVYDISLTSVTKAWILASGFSVSKSFLLYREYCVKKAEAHQKLKAREELALSGIMVIDDNICEERYLPVENVEEALKDIEAIDYFHVPEPDAEESSLCQRFAYQMQQRKVNNDHVDKILDDIQSKGKFKQLRQLFSSFARVYCMDYTIQPANEATLVHDTIEMMTDAYFRNSPIIKCLGADNMSSSSSARFTNMDPSLVNHGKRPDFSVISNREKHLLLALEAKRCGRNVSGDFVKLAKLLKDSLNQISTSGYKGVAVVGFLLKGSVCNVYVMDHVYDYLYRMVLVSKINVPRDRYDMISLLSAIPILKKASLIVDDAARIINRPTPDQKDITQRTMAFHSPIRINNQSSKSKLNRNHPRTQRACRKLNFSL